jgi:hypothetical protein
LTHLENRAMMRNPHISMRAKGYGLYSEVGVQYASPSPGGQADG